MAGVRPCSTSTDPGPNPPAKRPRIQLDRPAQWDLEGPIHPWTWQGQPEILPTSQLGSAPVHMPGVPIVIQPGSFGALGQVPHCLSPSFSPSAEGCDPRSSSSHKGSMMSPLPDSPLQPLPPPPPRSPEEQLPLRPRNPSRPPCKARRRLF